MFNRYLYHPRTHHVWINVTRGRTNIYLSDLNKLKVCVHQNVRKATPNHNISRDLWHKQYTRDMKMRQPQILKMKNNTPDMRIYWFKLISTYKLKNGNECLNAINYKTYLGTLDIIYNEKFDWSLLAEIFFTNITTSTTIYYSWKWKLYFSVTKNHKLMTVNLWYL